MGTPVQQADSVRFFPSLAWKSLRDNDRLSVKIVHQTVLEEEKTAMTTKGAAMRRSRPVYEVTWEEIREPGAYVEVATGKLYRIPPENLPVGSTHSKPAPDAPSSPLVRLSDDPFIFALAARMLCVEHHIWPHF
jgi:hypothetical protein